MDKNFDQLKEIVAKALEIDAEQLNEDSAYGETTNWDSLNHVSIINELEKHYGIQIPDSEIETYMTMKALIALHRNQTDK